MRAAKRRVEPPQNILQPEQPTKVVMLAPEMSRFVRNTIFAAGVMAFAAIVWRPARPSFALGIVGGAVLAGLSFWALRGMVDQLVIPRETGEKRPVSRGFQLVKFFTRHVILALAAYVMMLRLRLDPVGMIVGVTSAVVAAAFEARRRR